MSNSNKVGAGLQPAPVPQQAGSSAALAVGRRLRDLQVQQLLATGSTTGVYRALDSRSKQTVVLKEYLPQALAQRLANGHVQPLAAHMAAAYHRGLQAFLNEARLLMAVQHPALVQVLRFWEQDGTAYLVMPLVEGATLQHWLAGLGTPPSEDWLRKLLAPLMQALQALHGHGGHHGDVSLQSIWLQFDNRADSYLEHEPRPLLLGFSAACRALASAQAGAAPALHSGYGPIEQSDNAITVRQGAWSDVYALCAVMYAAIAGRPPPPSLARLARDDMVSARKVGHGRYSPAFLDAIDAGLAVRPHERVQSIEALRQQLHEPAAGFMASAVSALAAANANAGVLGAAGTVRSKHRPLPALQAARRNGSPVPHSLWPAAVGAVLLLLALVGALLRN